MPDSEDNTEDAVSVTECEAGGGTVEFNPGGYPRHCRGGIHDGKPLSY